MNRVAVKRLQDERCVGDGEAKDRDGSRLVGFAGKRAFSCGERQSSSPETKIVVTFAAPSIATVCQTGLQQISRRVDVRHVSLKIKVYVLLK